MKRQATCFPKAGGRTGFMRVLALAGPLGRRRWALAGALMLVAPVQAHPLACSYGSTANGLDVAEACATATPAGWSIAPAVLAALGYDHGLASVAIHGEGWFYRRRDGLMVRVLTFDNGPDYFVEGLARAVIDGELAYVDRRLRVRLRTRYNWGEPFANGRAAVCTGCVETRVDGGEHMVMTGGRWAVIDRAGREVPAAAGR